MKMNAVGYCRKMCFINRYFYVSDTFKISSRMIHRPRRMPRRKL
jgi:hypothetical protein